MNIATSLSDFLHDKNYFISHFENKIHIYKYLTLDLLSSDKIIVNMESFNLQILGEDLCVSAMNKDELLIRGKVYELKKEYK